METLDVITYYAILAVFVGLAGLVMWEKYTRPPSDDSEIDGDLD